jgi:hypothetical protein
MRPLATIRSYEELVAALRERAEALDVSNGTLDEVCGLSDRYASKVLGLHPSRSLGKASLAGVLGGLGAVLILCEDEEALARVRARLEKRRRSVKRARSPMLAHGVRGDRRFRFPDSEFARGAQARWQVVVGPARRSEIARAAAAVRWENARKAAGGASPNGAEVGEQRP